MGLLLCLRVCINDEKIVDFRRNCGVNVEYMNQIKTGKEELCMENIISKFTSGGIAIALLTFFVNINPITLLTASELELKLSKKEKRFSHNAFHYIFKVCLLSLISTAFTLMFFEQNINIYIKWSLLVVSSLGTIVIMYFILRKQQNFNSLIKGNKPISVVFLIFIAIIYTVASIITIPYLFADKMKQISITTMEELLHTIIVLLIFYAMISIFLYIPFYNMYHSSFYFEKQKRNFYIKIGDVEWSLLDPIDDSRFLLGNEKSHEVCTEFMIMNKEDLYKEIIKVKKKEGGSPTPQ